MLTQPEELLPGITYEELKTLSLAYPFSNNLKTLLAMKAKMDDHPEAARSLALAATYALDRTQLFLIMSPVLAIIPEKALHEAVLELKPIESIQRKLESLETIALQKEQEASLKAQEETPPEEAAPAETPSTPREDLLDAITLPGFEHFVPKPTSATPKQSFTSWYGQFNLPLLERLPQTLRANPPQPALEPEPVDPESREPKQKPASGVAQALAERSVAENKDVVSETLAKLLARQGHKERAIAMYERLCLAIPEKSAFFAAEIEKLRS